MSNYKNKNEDQNASVDGPELDDDQLEDVAGGAAWSPEDDWDGAPDMKDGYADWGPDGWVG